MRVNAPKDCSITSNSLKQLHWIEDKEKKIFDLDFSQLFETEEL